MKAIIFDLDGTLLNTLDDIANCMNRVLIRNSFMPYPAEKYKDFVGEGMFNLVKNAANPFTNKTETIGIMHDEMKKEYADNWHINTKPYEGIMDVLSQLEKAGILLSVLSNKPDTLTKMTVQYFFPTISFFHVQGALANIPRKPDPAGVLTIIQKSTLPNTEFMLIGDSGIDIETANNAFIFPAGVLWGFREREELEKQGAKLLFTKPLDILKLIN